MKAAVVALLLCFVVSCIYGQQQPALFVPLVPINPSSFSANVTQLIGSFHPNGTLAPGQLAYFYTYIESDIVNKHYGISIYLNKAKTLNPNAYYSNFTMFIKKGQVADNGHHSEKDESSCTDQPCNYWLVTPSIGVCDPSSGAYYFSILNTGNETQSFQLEVDVDAFGGTFLGCAANNSISRVLKIILIVSGVLVFLLIVVIIACCCSSRSKRHVHYHQCDSEKQHIVVPQPVVYATQPYNNYNNGNNNVAYYAPPVYSQQPPQQVAYKV